MWTQGLEVPLLASSLLKKNFKFLDIRFWAVKLEETRAPLLSLGGWGSARVEGELASGEQKKAGSIEVPTSSDSPPIPSCISQLPPALDRRDPWHCWRKTWDQSFYLLSRSLCCRQVRPWDPRTEPRRLGQQFLMRPLGGARWLGWGSNLRLGCEKAMAKNEIRKGTRRLMLKSQQQGWGGTFASSR